MTDGRRLGRARRDPRSGDPGHLARRPRRGQERVASRAERVRVEFTPTFMGCPALERDAARDGGDGRARSAASRDVDVVLDDSWSTDRITPEGREKLRAAGFAPPAPRAAGSSSSCSSSAASAARTAARRDAAREHLRPDAVPLDPLLRRAAGSRSSSSRRSSHAGSAAQAPDEWHRVRGKSALVALWGGPDLADGPDDRWCGSPSRHEGDVVQLPARRKRGRPPASAIPIPGPEAGETDVFVRPRVPAHRPHRFRGERRDACELRLSPSPTASRTSSACRPSGA